MCVILGEKDDQSFMCILLWVCVLRNCDVEN